MAITIGGKTYSGSKAYSPAKRSSSSIAPRLTNSITGGSNVQGTIDVINIARNLETQNTLLSTDVQNVIHSNLIGLGEASVDISEALNRQIDIRQSQRKEDQTSVMKIFDYTLDRFADVSEKLGALGQASVDISEAIASPSLDAISDSVEESVEGASWFPKFPELTLPSFEQLKNPLIIAGLAIAGLIIIPRLIKSGFKW